MAPKKKLNIDEPKIEETKQTLPPSRDLPPEYDPSLPDSKQRHLR